MSKGLKRFKERALAHPEVKREYDRLLPSKTAE